MFLIAFTNISFIPFKFGKTGKVKHCTYHICTLCKSQDLKTAFGDGVEDDRIKYVDIGFGSYYHWEPMSKLEKLTQAFLMPVVVFGISSCEPPPTPKPTFAMTPKPPIMTPTLRTDVCIPPEYPSDWRLWGANEELEKVLESGKTFRVYRSGLLVTALIESPEESKIYERGFLYRYQERFLKPPGNLVTYNFYACDEENVWLSIYDN